MEQEVTSREAELWRLYGSDLVAELQTKILSETRWPAGWTKEQAEQEARGIAERIARHRVHTSTLPPPPSITYGLRSEPAFHLSKERQRQLDKTGHLNCTQCRVPLPGTMADVVGRIVLCEGCWRELALSYADTFDTDILYTFRR